MSSGQYVVNNHAQLNGDHEVHVQGCTFFPASHIPLGFHSSCRTAVADARRHYRQSNGCAYCARECHTS